MNKATLTKQINKVKAEIAIIQRVIERPGTELQMCYNSNT